MGFQDRDYWADKHREIEQGASGGKSRPGQKLPSRPSAAPVARAGAASKQRPSSGPPELGQVMRRWWFQVLVWLALGAALYALFRHVQRH